MRAYICAYEASGRSDDTRKRLAAIYAITDAPPGEVVQPLRLAGD